MSIYPDSPDLQNDDDLELSAALANLDCQQPDSPIQRPKNPVPQDRISQLENVISELQLKLDAVQKEMRRMWWAIENS